jgi:hypothetical protein
MRFVIFQTVWNGRPGGPLAGGTCIGYGVGLSAICATAAGHALVLDDLAIKVVLGLDNAAKEHPAVHASTGAQALKAAELRLYSVIVIVCRWVRVGCARLLCGHEDTMPLRGPCLGVLVAPPGLPIVNTRIIPCAY